MKHAIFNFIWAIINSQKLVRNHHHVAKCQNKPDAVQYGDHLTSVLGRVRPTRWVVFVQPLQNILNPPELLLNVPVHQLTLRGEKILLDKQLIETEKTHALLKHCQNHYNNSYSFLLIFNERITCRSITDCIIHFHPKDFEHFLLH